MDTDWDTSMYPTLDQVKGGGGTAFNTTSPDPLSYQHPVSDYGEQMGYSGCDYGFHPTVGTDPAVFHESPPLSGDLPPELGEVVPADFRNLDWESYNLVSADFNLHAENSTSLSQSAAPSHTATSTCSSGFNVTIKAEPGDFSMPCNAIVSKTSVPLKQEMSSPEADSDPVRRRPNRLAEVEIDKELRKKRRKYREELSHLPPQEARKKEKRRAQNRRAAARCREKKKGYYECLQESKQREEEKRLKYEAEVLQLRRQVESMTTFLNTHKCVMRQSGTPQYSATSQHSQGLPYQMPVAAGPNNPASHPGLPHSGHLSSLQ